MNYFPELNMLIYDQFEMEDIERVKNRFRTEEEIKIYTNNIDKQNESNSTNKNVKSNIPLLKRR